VARRLGDSRRAGISYRISQQQLSLVREGLSPRAVAVVPDHTGPSVTEAVASNCAHKGRQGNTGFTSNVAAVEGWTIIRTRGLREDVRGKTV
jgi:hypothetical protein